ncbi:MAG: DUF4468 domain-containing protein [Prevotella sp.]|nr:DUF4468 domain-containing protein [Prevotella sp.]
MNRLLMTVVMALSMPIWALAQGNTWETNENLQQTNVPAPNPDAKYLAGAVPEVDGKVVFSVRLKAPGLSAGEIYTRLLAELKRQVSEPGQFEQSRVAYTDADRHELAGSYMEWLVFKSTALVLDRTRLMYRLVITCRDGEADMTMQNIHYLYDEERQPEAINAEDWITDKQGLNRKQTKLARLSGKFRRKTIDRKDYLFKRYQDVLDAK